MTRPRAGLVADAVGAQFAVSSARLDNAASLAVSRSVGYVDNGHSVVRSPSGTDTLQHVRLTRERWVASGLGRQVTVTGVAGCRPWFGVPRNGWGETLGAPASL